MQRAEPEWGWGYQCKLSEEHEMNKASKYFGLVCLAASIGCGGAFAQATAPSVPAAPAPSVAPAMPKATAPAAATPKAEPKPRTEKSKECSKQADAKKLHGKERQKFREECKKTA